MKPFLYSLIAISFFLFTDLQSFAQNENQNHSPAWVEMMQDKNANFFAVQDSFNSYFANRKRTKGDGWKPFKRWEHYMKQRVDLDGTFPTPDAVMNEYAAFMAKYGASGPKSTSGNWQELGPVTMPTNLTGQPNGLGRLNGIAFHPTNANIFYVAAPSGGVWKTTNGGTNWTPLTDTLPTLGASCLLIDPTNTNIIYLGSGDRDAGDAPGMGVLKSTNGGISWTFANSGMGNETVGDMLMHPSNSSILIAATTDGIYRSTNAGASWTKTSPNSNNFKDLEFKPGDPNTVYAAGSGFFYKSTNNGVSWTSITSGLPNTGRYVIGVSANNANYVYVVSGGSNGLIGCYRSTNSGTSFSTRSTSPNILGYSETGNDTRSQAWYDLAIAVNPTNANEIYVGGINIWKSTNGGSSWTLNAHWVGGGFTPEVHADIHALNYNPLNSRLYCCNDGGLYYTTNGGTSWPEISSGLAIAQVYKIGQSATQKSLIINGYQDNGTAYVSNGAWNTVIGGDGMECIVDPTNTNYMYGALYYGNITRKTPTSLYFEDIAGDQINGINEEGDWVTPYILHVTNPNTMFAGYKNLWRSTNIKAANASSVTWTKISTSLGGSNSYNIKVLEQSEANPSILYIAREDDKLFRSDNINGTTPTYTNLSSGLPSSYTPSDIEAHPTNQNIVYMTFYQDVYKSTNKGVSWTNISGNLPNISMNCIVFDTASTNDAIYVGTDAGVYYRDNSMSNWIPFMSGMPAAAEITELEIYYNSNPLQSSIVASTYGRGLWQSDLYSAANATPLCEFGASGDLICTGDTIQFTDSTLFSPTSWQWTFTPSNVSYVGGTSSSSQNPLVKFSTAGYYTVKLVASNANGSDSITKTDLIKVGGFLTPFTEDFEATSTTLGNWGISNPDNGITWALATVGGVTPGTRAVYLNHYSYSATGEFDYLFSPILNLSNLGTASLNFKHAYTRYTGYATDSFFIFATDNCGATWSQILAIGENGNGNFATYPNNTYSSGNSFVPAIATDWCGAGVGPSCFNINLNSYAGEDDVRVVFVTKNSYSNNLYLDNIQVSGTISTTPTASFTVGSPSVCTGTQVTFTNTSQNAISYIWKQNGVVISTAQNLTKTFTTAGTFQIRLIATNSNGSDSVSQNIVVGTGAGIPATPTGTNTLCVNASNTNYTTTGASNANSYNWVLSPSSAGTISGTSTTATVDWNNSFSGIAVVQVQGVNNCGLGPISDSLVITINPTPAAPSQPTGPISLCLNPANSTYSITGVTGATSYQWSISPSGAGLISGTGTTATVDWNNSFTGTATITASGVNNCGTGSSSTALSVAISAPPATPTTPTGLSQVCQGSSNISYQVNQVSSASGYEWLISPASAGTISGTGTTATVNWSATYAGSATISARAFNNCGNGSYSPTLTVVVGVAPATPDIPSGDITLCQDSPNSTYSTNSVTGATSYSWQIAPTTAGTVSGSTTSASVNWNAQFSGNAQLTVAAVGSCGTGNYSGALAITIYPNPAQPTITQNYDSLLSSYTIGNQWHTTNGIIIGATDYFYIPSANGLYSVEVTDANGCKARSADYAMTNIGIPMMLNEKEVRIYPNPANDIVHISYSGTQQLDLRLYNVLGQKVLQSSFSGITQLNVQSLSSGLYYVELRLQGNDAEVISRRIVIQRD